MQSEQKTFSALIAAHPEKAAKIQASLSKLLSKQAEKKLLGLVNVSQRVLGDYTKLASPKDFAQHIPVLSDAIVALCASRGGAVAACNCFAYGNIKASSVLFDVRPRSLFVGFGWLNRLMLPCG